VQIALRVFPQQHVPVEVVVVMSGLSVCRLCVARGGREGLQKTSCWAISKTRRAFWSVRARTATGAASLWC